MIKNYFGTYRIYCIGIENADSGHLAVCIPVEDNHMVIFDTAGNYFTNQAGNVYTGLSVEDALADWLDWWSYNGMSGAEVALLFNDEYYYEFDGNEDFLDWYLNY